MAKRAEELGFNSVWFEDSQMVAADPFVAMAASAMHTTRIRLGTGVCIPTNRIPPVTANMLATLNQLAPGRIDWGVGTGFSARRAMGLSAISVETLGRHLRAVHGLLARETVEWDFGAGRRRKIRFLNPDVPLFNTTDPIATHVAAMGPKSRQLAAELGCHWITLYISPGQLADARYLTLHRGHALFMRPEEDAVLPAEFIRKSTFTGTVTQLAELVKAIADAGYSEVSFVVLPQYPDAVEDWARVMETARV